MTVKEFLQMGYTSWAECHYSIAATEEQARAWFTAHGLNGTMYRVPFGYWMPVSVPV